MAAKRGYTRATGPSARVILNRGALDKVVLAVADGMFEAGRVIIEQASARAPDSPLDPYPIGEGLPKQGGVLAYANNTKVNGWHERGGQPPKPRSARLLTKEHSVTVLAGFGFPGRFAELGTIRTRAQPFLAPARDVVGVQGVINIVGEVTRPELERMP